MSDHAPKEPGAPPVTPAPNVVAMLAAYNELTKCLLDSANVIGLQSFFMTAACQTYMAAAKVNAIAQFLTEPAKDPNQSADDRLVELITEQAKQLAQAHQAAVDQAKKNASRIALPPPMPPRNPTPHGPVNGRRR